MASELAHHWTLDPTVDFLNHASYGATPRPVQAAQQRWRDRMEAEPVRFFPQDLALVPNATAGTNSVLRSLRFGPGDELLTTDHAYNAARNATEFVAERDGARVVVASVPFPLTSPQQVTDALLRCVTPRTRLAVVDHITSATALV